MVKIMENHISKWDDLGGFYPLFSETPSCWFQTTGSQLDNSGSQDFIVTNQSLAKRELVMVGGLSPTPLEKYAPIRQLGNHDFPKSSGFKKKQRIFELARHRVTQFHVTILR